jgi:aminomethyltransferase
MTAAPIPAGYEALRENVAWLDVSSRGRIKATGEDRARLLHAMTTNHVQQLKPGEGCYAFFLDARGRILSDVNILCRPDHFLLDTEPETREKIFEHLDKFIIADDVTLEDLAPTTAGIAIAGPKAEQALQSLGATLPEKEYQSLEWGPRLLVRLSYTGDTGFLVVLPEDQKQDFVDELNRVGIVEASPEAFRIVRLEHGKARYGDDLSERFLAQEANQPHALHFSKGCYLGQEIVERVRSRGQIHRVLMPLQLGTTDAPAAGAKLQVDGKDVAEITSAVFSPALGKVVALAYIRSEFAKPGTRLALGDTLAFVEPAADS